MLSLSDTDMLAGRKMTTATEFWPRDLSIQTHGTKLRERVQYLLK